jgi:cholesterol transport system auxiliary component
MMRLFALTPMLLLAGCVTLLPEAGPAPRIYVLEAGDVVAAENPGGQGVVTVALPSGERTLLGQDIIWRSDDELAFVAQARWSNRADLALQSMLVETLTRQQRFAATARTGEARGDYEIRWEVLDFEVDESSMTARFAADVKLVVLPGRRIVSQRVIETQAPVDDRSSSAATQALARAAREGSARIGVFAAESAAQASAASISR